MTDLRTDPPVTPEPGTLRRVADCIAHEATPTDVRNIRRWGAWMLAWALVSFADAEWFGGVTGETSAVTLGLAAATAAVLVGLVLAFARFIRESDELNRQIHLRGLAVGFALGFLVALVGEALEKAAVVDRLQVDVVALVMILGYGLTTVAITARYR